MRPGRFFLVPWGGRAAAIVCPITYMEVIVLGSGTSQGVPMIGCSCPVCTSPDPRNRRTRASIHVVMDGLHVQVDAAPEFRLQCLKEGVDKLDLFILTHGHSDHIAGMDDLRRFCDLAEGRRCTVYTTEEGMARVLAIYPYAIMERPVVRGYPAFKLAEMPPAHRAAPGHDPIDAPSPRRRADARPRLHREEQRAQSSPITPTASGCPARRSSWPAAPTQSILDGLRPQPAPVPHEHRRGRRGRGGPWIAGRIWLTHLTHLTEHAAAESLLPEGFGLAYDGLRIAV